MKLVIATGARKALVKMPAADAQALSRRLRAVASDPYGDHPYAKSFGGGVGRVRQGDWRAVYEIDAEAGVMTVTLIGHRREIYR